jgi:hypothetical protein
MPEPRLAGGQLTESSLSTEGYDGSMLSGGSFLSGTDTTSGILFTAIKRDHTSYILFFRFGAHH